jgi:hypothetical protein
LFENFSDLDGALQGLIDYMNEYNIKDQRKKELNETLMQKVFALENPINDITMDATHNNANSQLNNLQGKDKIVTKNIDSNYCLESGEPTSPLRLKFCDYSDNPADIVLAEFIKKNANINDYKSYMHEKNSNMTEIT